MSKCCEIGCGLPAEWEIKSTKDEYDVTHACDKHVGVLLGDKDPYVVYRVAR